MLFRSQKLKDQQGKDAEWDVWSCDFDADGYRLPTEAEWEYACRSVSSSGYCFGSDESLLPEYGYFVVNSKSRAWPGGNLLPNGFGLFDMHGNAWEWCWDGHAAYAEAATTDPTGPTGHQGRRLLRGGAWLGNPRNCRSANRYGDLPTLHYNDFGLRVVCAGVAAKTFRD